ncbi:MAG: tRNA lysidine(34) synthetase TilS [Candidatus Methylomirabilia bacterium]
MVSPPLLPGLLAYVARHRLVAKGSRVIAAVSGGADSTCLASLLFAARERLGISLEVAHFNHQLRGRQAQRDAAAVEAMARRLGLRFHLGLGGAFTAQMRRSASVQELAREMRLGFLLGLARRRRAIVALGHTGDDQSETMVMRFLAGAGPAGLGGIPPASHGGLLVHPLLFARRAAIESWLAARGVPWRTDPTNRTRRYLRNRLRLDLLPVLAREYNPRLVERLGALAEVLRRDADFIGTHAAHLLEIAGAGPKRYAFTDELLAATHPAVLSRALLLALRAVARRPADFSSRHVEALLAPGPGARSWDLPGGVRCNRDGAGLTLARATTATRAAARPPAALRLPGRVLLPSGDLVTARVRAKSAGFDPRAFGADPRRVALDLGGTNPPLTIRSRLPGDRLRPLGLAAEKKLKELLIEAKIPARQRNRVPLVCDRDGIVWVAGLRPAERCRVHAGTKQLLVLEFKPGEESFYGSLPVSGGSAAFEAGAAGCRRRTNSPKESRGPAMSVSRSSSASSASRSGRVRLRTPSLAGSAAAPDGDTSTSSKRTGRNRSSISSAPSGARSDSADGTFTAAMPSRPGRDQR